MAAIACAPPTQKTSSIPATAAAARVASSMWPSGPGGTQSTISSTPATCGGPRPTTTAAGYGDGAHRTRGGGAGGATGGVAPGTPHRPDQMADPDPTGIEVVGRRSCRFVGVVRQDPVMGDVQRILKLGRHAPEGRPDLRSGDP